MKKYRNIYVAATSQHVGKTTSTLGLVSAFLRRGVNVGYCKPVGQKSLDINNLIVDKDAVLFADLIDFDLSPEVHSPVILGKGATSAYLDDPTATNYTEDIRRAAQHLQSRHELTIHEGTGHPGVGSVADLSNATVAKMVDAGVVMVVEGGIGKTIDMLNMCKALFDKEGVPIIGIIINKVHEDKIEKIKRYVGKWLDQQQIPLLGCVPYDKTLAYPLIWSISKAVQGTIIFNKDKATNKIENIVAGSLIDLKELSSSQDLLLVVSTKSINNAINKIKQITETNNFEHSPLSGIVATGSGNIAGNTLSYIEEHQLPLIRTDLDTYGSVIKISNIEVKINRQTPWKVRKAIDLIDANVDIDYIAQQITL